MFGVKHNECVGFESRWKVKRVYAVGTSQTKEYSTTEQCTNTAHSDNIEIQTDPVPTPTLDEPVDDAKVAKFLQKIYPNVKKAIDDCNTSQAFKGYKLQSDLEDGECKILQKLKVSNFGNGDMTSRRIASLTWNHTGKSLAFSSNFEHKSWCYHTGAVFVYTLAGNNKFPDLPKKRLSTESCVVCLKFHPVRPNILAGSTFSGSVVIWDIQSDDGEEVITTKNAHQEVVTQILWTNDVNLDKTLLLVTTSTDGLLKLWRYQPHDEEILVLRTRFKVKPPLLASFRRPPDNEESSTSATSEGETFGIFNNGIVCFDFSKHFPDMFLVGLEGGHIVQCSLLGATELKGSTRSEPLYDPTFKYYESHEGEIISVSFSPNRKDMFMTYSTDAEIRIYLIGQVDPAQLIFLKSTLLDLTFVPFEDKLIAGCGLTGFMEVYHLQKSKRIDIVTKEEIKKKVTSTSLAVNFASFRNHLVAIGCANGELQLWKVPWVSYAEN